MISKKLVVGYVRTSTIEQQKKGYGIDIQIREIEKFAKDNKLKIDKIFKDEAISGTKENRAELDILRNLCQKNEVKAVIFPSTDRTARSVRISENLYYELSRHSVKLYFADMPFYDNDNHSDVMVRQIKEVVAEGNRNAIVERLKKGREERVRKGHYSGGNIPYGYRRKDKELQTVSKEANIIKAIYNLANLGQKCQQIADYLNSQGYRRRNKKEWSQRQIWSILHREKLYKEGVVKYGQATGKNKKLIIINDN